MSMPWGPAIDAELGYRQQQVRSGYRRAQSRRAARSTARTTHRHAARNADTPTTDNATFAVLVPGFRAA